MLGCVIFLPKLLVVVTGERSLWAVRSFVFIATEFSFSLYNPLKLTGRRCYVATAYFEDRRNKILLI